MLKILTLVLSMGISSFSFAAHVDKKAKISCKTPYGHSYETVSVGEVKEDGSRKLFVSYRQIRDAQCTTTPEQVTCTWGLFKERHVAIDLTSLDCWRSTLTDEETCIVYGIIDTGLLSPRTDLTCHGIRVIW